MIRDILSHIKEHARKTEPKQIIVSSSMPRIELKEEFFHPLEPAPKPLLFIDGGNAELFSSPHVAVHFLRVAAVQGTTIKRGHWHVVISTKPTENGLRYTFTFFGDNPPFDSFEIDPDDPSLQSQGLRCSPSQAIHMVRRLTELTFAKTSLEGCPEGTSVILDGILETRFPKEQQFLNELKEAAENKGGHVAGFAKTSEVLCDNGISPNLWLLKKKGEWCFADPSYPHAFATSFVRLNEKSEHIFRLDAARPAEVAAALLPTATDAAFIGYPYGLIKVDRFARVSEEERKMRMVKLIAADDGFLETLSKSVDAHSILDHTK